MNPPLGLDLSMGALNCKGKRDQMTVNEDPPEPPEPVVERKLVLAGVPKNKRKAGKPRRIPQTETAEEATEQEPSINTDDGDRAASSSAAKNTDGS